LLQKAIQLETVDGDLNAAIQIYKQIIAAPGANRAVVAKALLQLGKCHEKLGNTEARKAYEQLLREYADQGEITAEAQTRLAAMDSSSEKDSGIRMQQLMGESGYAPFTDGRYLSYADFGAKGNLALRDLVTGKTRYLTSTADGRYGFAHASTISPDGKLVAYAWLNETGGYDLRLVPIDGGEPRIVYSDKRYEVFPGSWSRDCNEIAVRRYIPKDATGAGPATAHIALIKLADRSLRVLKTLDRPYWMRLSHSPDNRYLAYDYPVSRDGGKSDISLLSTEGSSEIPVVQHPSNDRLLGWIPGTQDLLFRSDRSGTDDLFKVRISGGRSQEVPEPIKRAIGEIAPVGFGGDGSFYFSIFTRWATMRVAPFDPESGRIQSQESKPLLGSNMDPDWSPDGEYLAYCSEQTLPAGPGHPVRRVRIQNLKTGEDRELAGHLDIKGPHWSPDGRALLVVGQDTGNRQAGIYRIEFPTGRASLLVNSPVGPGGIGEACWSSDGKAMIYSKGSTLVVRDLEAGREKELLKHPDLLPYMAVSPDGRYLALGTRASKNIQSTLLILSVEGGTPRELLKLEGQHYLFGCLTWTPDGKYLLFAVEEGRDSFGLYRIRTEGGDVEKLLESKDLFSGLAVHPDGRRIAFSILTQETEIWAMKNLRTAGARP
jgi:Tol biopolymer transport system component